MFCYKERLDFWKQLGNEIKIPENSDRPPNVIGSLFFLGNAKKSFSPSRILDAGSL
jgi:hypothetical protein